MKFKVKKGSHGSFVIITFVVVAILGIVTIILGPPPSGTLLYKDTKTSMSISREFYRLKFNKETKQPFWVLQFPRQEAFNRVLNEPLKNYYQDLDIPKKDQANEADYKGSHWVMSNFLFPLPKLAEERDQDQYLFSVTSPQDPEFHQGYWKKLRGRVKRLAMKNSGDRVGVLSGPLFLLENTNTHSNKRVFGDNRIPVPTHFFQVIAPTSDPRDMEAYIVPNEKINEQTPLRCFKVSLKEFEKKTKIKGVKSITNNLEVVGPGLP